MSCISWVGGAASVTVLTLGMKRAPENADAFQSASLAAKLLDDALIVPGALACVFTGILLSLLTSYSFTRFYWIVVKTVLAVWSLVFGLFILRPWINAAAATALGQAPDLDATCCTPANMVIGFVQFAMLAGLVFISVIKPWRRIPADDLAPPPPAELQTTIPSAPATRPDSPENDMNSLEDSKNALRQLHRLRRCFRLCRAITASQGLELTLESLVDNVMDNLGAKNASLYLVDASGEELMLTLSRGPLGSRLKPGLKVRRGQGVVGRVFESGKTVRIEDAVLVDPSRDLFTDADPGEATTMLCIPLSFEDQLLGVAKLTDKVDGTRFDEDDQEIFEFACGQASLAIHQSYVREMEVDRERMELQMEKAAQVQRILLPEADPDIPGFDISAGSVSCDEIGGDYLDFLADPDGLPGVLGLAVGDVVGHGVPAALLMATLRAYMRSGAGRLTQPDELVRRVNELFTRDTFKEAHFCTLFLLVIDAGRRCLEWVNAGHDPAVSYNPRTGEFTELSGSSYPLGMDEHSRYQGFDRCGCETGQVCLLATDGLFETMSPSHELYGRDRAKALIREHAGLSAADIRRIIMEDAARFRQGGPQRDDVTVAVIKALDPGPDQR